MWLIQERPPGAVVRAWCPKRSEEDVLWARVAATARHAEVYLSVEAAVIGWAYSRARPAEDLGSATPHRVMSHPRPSAIFQSPAFLLGWPDLMGHNEVGPGQPRRSPTGVLGEPGPVRHVAVWHRRGRWLPCDPSINRDDLGLRVRAASGWRTEREREADRHGGPTGRAGDPAMPVIGLAEAYALGAFRHAGVPMQRIRPAIDVLARELGLEYARLQAAVYTPTVQRSCTTTAGTRATPRRENPRGSSSS